MPTADDTSTRLNSSSDRLPKTETEVVEMCWQKVFKEIQSNVAVTAMVKESLDQAGATICFHAFDLVSKTLDGPNMIRKIHKSENETLNTALTNAEGPWYEKNVTMHTKYDYRGVWLTRARNGKLYQTLKNAHKEPEWINLSPQIVCDTFCEPVSESEVQHALQLGFADEEKSNLAKKAFDDIDIFLFEANKWFKLREIQNVASLHEKTKFDQLINQRLEYWEYEFDDLKSRNEQIKRYREWKSLMLHHLDSSVDVLKAAILQNCAKFGYAKQQPQPTTNQNVEDLRNLNIYMTGLSQEVLLELLSMSHKLAEAKNDNDSFGGIGKLVENVNDYLILAESEAILTLVRDARQNRKRLVMIEFITLGIAEIYRDKKILPPYKFFFHPEDIRRPTQQELTDLPLCAKHVTDTIARVKYVIGTARHTNAVFAATHQSSKNVKEDPDVSFGAYIVPKRPETDFLFLLSAPQNSEIVQDVKKLKRPIRRWQKKVLCDAKDKTMNAAKILVHPRLYNNLPGIKDKIKPLEPYWLFDLRRKRNWTRQNQDKYRYQYEDVVVLPVQKPDLMIEVSYNSKKVVGVKKRVVFIEVDGEDKTTGQKSRKPSEKNSVRSQKKKKEKSDDEEDDIDDEDDDDFDDSDLVEVRYETNTMSGGSEALMDDKEVNRITKKDSGGNPAKLAMKMMQSVGVQMVLQPYTYNIRSNFYSFLKKKIEKSLFSTTNVQIPEYQELLSTLKARNNTVNSTQNDYEDLLRCIHLMHHIYIAHVKVAFYIYMFETYDIDLLAKLDNPFMYNQDVERQESLSRMRDKHFFINFQAYNIPEELHFNDTMDTHVKEFLENSMMLQSRIKTKYCNENDMVSTWQQAPVMDANSKRSNMHHWTANVHRQLFPLFPNEFESIVNVAYAAVERVNMKELCKIVLHAAKESFEAYYKSYKLELRSLDGLEFKRREFPDRCYLTRREQMDRTKWWNKNYFDDNRDNQFTTLQTSVNAYNLANQQNEIDFPDVDNSRASGVALRKRAKKQEHDQIEIFLGYEEPVLKRQAYNSNRRKWTSKDYAMLKWDQVDVRMHFFDYAMRKEETFEKFQKYSRGVWYLQDYIDFFNMLRSIVFANDSQQNADYSDFTTADEIRQQIVAGNLTLLDNIIKSSAWRLKLYLSDEDINSVITPTTKAGLLAYNANWQTLSSVTTNNGTKKMPSQSSQAAKAYHIFAIMSWFFDCRDGGACQFQWEDSILEYFGSEITESDESIKSNFDIFRFEEPKRLMPDVTYFNNMWFQMTMFLEHNFRNAVAAVHYKLFQIDVIEDNMEYLAPHKIGSEYDIGLQAKIRKLVARRSSLLNNRAAFVGLKNVSRELSFKKFDPQKNTALTLRERILSQLDDDLPLLDPTLKNYVQQFKIPDSILFLRIIRCPNILALRELAVQHISPHPHKYLQEVLAFFDPAVQSEIEVMLKFVHTDDSVYAATPQAHASSRVLLTRKCMLRWMHEIVDLQYMASGRLNCMYFCKTPLQCKFMMMMQANTVFMLERLLCKQELLNYASNRPIRFVLLQLRLLYNLLSCKTDENSHKKSHKNIWRNDDFDDLLYYSETSDETLTVPASINPVTTCFCISWDHCISYKNVYWTPGASRCEWPARDSNFVSFGPHKNNAKNAAKDLNSESEETEDASDVTDDESISASESLDNDDDDHQNYPTLSNKFPFPIDRHNLPGEPSSSPSSSPTSSTPYTYHITAQNQNAEFCEMSAEEQAMWLMLAYIRPHAALQMHEDNAFSLESQSVLILQNTSLRRDQEDIVAHCDPQLDVNDAQLKCVIHADMSNEAHMFLELSELQPRDKCKSQLPPVVQHLIPPIPNRKFIYIPPACATYIKQEHAKDVNDGFIFHDAFANKLFLVRRTFTGARCWTWKRFMIKTIFFHACSRIVSRNREFLALYAHPDDEKNHVLTKTVKDNVLEAHELLKNTVGNLEFKTKKIDEYFAKKKMMPTDQKFTLLIKTDREYRKYTDTFDSTKTYDAHSLRKTEKISPNKYGYWICKNICEKLLDETSDETLDETKMLGYTPTSCRYALILPRLLQSMKIAETMLEKSCTSVPSVAFVYRQYIYLEEPPKTLFVKYHEKYYIAFPKNYAILGENIVQFEPKHTKRTIISFCNTRYRSCLPLKYIRNATDAADISNILISDYAKDDQLKCILEQREKDDFMWDMKTFETNTSALGFLLNFKNNAAMNRQMNNHVLLPHTKRVICGHKKDYEKMFMLPDFFCTFEEFVDATEKKQSEEPSQKNQESAEDSTDELIQDLQLRNGESSIITHDKKQILQAFMKLRTRNTYNHLLHTHRDNNAPLQNILTLIDQIITPKSSEIF